MDDEDISFELLGVDSGARIFSPRYETENTLSIFREVNGDPVTERPTISSTGEGHLAVLNEFVEHVLANDFASNDGSFALHRSKIIDAIYESAATNQEVRL